MSTCNVGKKENKNKWMGKMVEKWQLKVENLFVCF